MNLDKKMGFQSQKPRAYTNAEKQARWRARHGSRMIRTDMSVDVAAAAIYLRKEWGFKTNREMVNAAIRFLAIQTRKGLEKLEVAID